MNIIDKVIISNDMPSSDNIWIHQIDGLYVALFYSPYGWKTISSNKSVNNDEADLFEFFNSTTQYHVGDIVRKDGALYKFTSNYIGQWDESKVILTSVYDELNDSKISLNESRDVLLTGIVEFDGERVEISSDLYINELLHIDPHNTILPDIEKWKDFRTLENCLMRASSEDIDQLFTI